MAACALLPCLLALAAPAAASAPNDPPTPADETEEAATPPASGSGSVSTGAPGAAGAAPAPALGTSAVAASAAAGDAELAESAKLAKINRLRPQGQTTEFSGVVDTIVRDAGGIRSALYDKGIFLDATTIHSLSYDVNGGRSPTSPQRYAGQKETYSSSNSLRAAVRLAEAGEDLAQFNIGATYAGTTWSQLGPNGFQITRLDISTTLFDRKVQISAGYGTNILNYIGIFAGGNPILANGLAGSIPVQGGLSASTAPTPALNIQVNGRNGFYSKSGIQRSLGPDGLIAEARANGIGLKFTRDGAKALYIQEFGVLRRASPEGRQIWLRAGGFYNSTDYARFDGRGTAKNWMAYALADYQLYKPGGQAFYRGVYVGASAMFTSDKVNVYTRTFEARTYAIGMVPGRPTDQQSLTIGYNKFGNPAGQLFTSLGQPVNKSQFSVSGLYAYRAAFGIYLTPSVAYIRNPSFIGDFKPAVNLAMAFTFLL